VIPQRLYGVLKTRQRAVGSPRNIKVASSSVNATSSQQLLQCVHGTRTRLRFFTFLYFEQPYFANLIIVIFFDFLKQFIMVFRGA